MISAGFSIMASHIPPLIYVISYMWHSSSFTAEHLCLWLFIWLFMRSTSVYCVIVALARTRTPVGILVCVYVRTRVYLTERVKEHRDAVGCLRGGCGLLLRCSYWR